MSQALDENELIPTRATLIQRLKNWEDQASWRDFFDTYWSLIYGVAIKAGCNKSEAQDVVQETMISVSRNIAAFKYDPERGSFKGWLLNVTRWRITDQLRHRPPVSELHDGTDQIMLEAQIFRDSDRPSCDMEQMWDEEWEKNLLEAAITKARRSLDPRQYQIFDFYVNKSWDPEKVAKMFNMQVGQVYQIRHRVTEAIKAEVVRLQKDIV